MEFFATVFFLMFFLVFGMVIVQTFRGLSQWNKNNHSPRLTVDAAVVAKRTNVSRHRHGGTGHTSTTYYVTFQVDSGDRFELSMSGADYGLIVEGDKGKLSFQGTRYLGFQRV